MGKKTQKIFKKHIKSFPHSQIGKAIKKETVKSLKTAQQQNNLPLEIAKLHQRDHLSLH